ncbi:unnamed protein product [Nesidiocoris tenuis]|uniref:Uncharacterized protein n=1 Tax=Nesidiocoris tenuis TaxID=355587 RepID=A0A6H5H856_9HEMI|nr:unnamed protein product [Nesidiocoris tenuis]
MFCPSAVRHPPLRGFQGQGVVMMNPNYSPSFLFGIANFWKRFEWCPNEEVSISVKERKGFLADTYSPFKHNSSIWSKKIISKRHLSRAETSSIPICRRSTVATSAMFGMTRDLTAQRKAAPSPPASRGFASRPACQRKRSRVAQIEPDAGPPYGPGGGGKNGPGNGPGNGPKGKGPGPLGPPKGKGPGPLGPLNGAGPGPLGPGPLGNGPDGPISQLNRSSLCFQIFDVIIPNTGRSDGKPTQDISFQARNSSSSTTPFPVQN